MYVVVHICSGWLYLGLYACAYNFLSIHVINHSVLHCRKHHILAMRMTAVHGSLAAFNSNTKEWTEYIERLEFYFTANGITDGTKQHAVLLSCCGPSTFRLMRSIVLPTPLTDFSFKELVAKMKAHQEPKPSVIGQRYQFNSHQRATTETVAEYVTALRKLAEHCNFGDSLNEMLRDRFVWYRQPSSSETLAR